MPILLMNLAQALAQAQLVCMGTGLDAPGVAAMHMLGLVVVQLFFLALSRVSRYAIATPDVTVGLLCHTAVASVYDSTGGLPEADKAQTALAALCMCTLLQGGCYLALGRLRASELVQYVPYPVVCGLLGVTGLGLCFGALGIAGFDAESLVGFSQLVQRAPAQFAATLAFAVASMSIASLSNSGTAFLLCVPAALLLFYGGASFNETSEHDLVTGGWLFPRSGHNHPLVDMWRARDVTTVYWRAAVPDTVATALRMLISLTALVLKVIAVEAAAGVPIDVDAELRTAGLANLAVGVLGGSLANHSALYVVPLRRAGVADRRVAGVTMGITLLVLASGLPLMDLMPRFVLAGLLLALGVQMCHDWVWASRRRMDVVGSATLWSMIVTMLSAGSTNALFVGLLAAVGSSHLRMSRLNALKYHRTGVSVHASVSRAPHARKRLQVQGKAIHLLGLEGFLFEGSTTRLLRYVLAEIRRSPGTMRFLVLDMAFCQGCDPSACALLGRAARMLSERRVQLVLANPQPSLLPTLVAHSVLPDNALAPASSVLFDASPALGGSLALGRANHFETLDRALEWCEDEVIMTGSPPSADSSCADSSCEKERRLYGASARGARETGGRTTRSSGGGGGGGGVPFAPVLTVGPEVLQPYGVQQPAKSGEFLCSGGTINPELYLVPPGVAVELTIEVGDADAHRPAPLATLRHGGLFGAEGALLGVPSLFSARVLSSEQRNATMLVISGNGLLKLRAGQPALLQKLLAAAVTQQQDVTAILARRTALWRGGGWRGPNWEAATRPEPTLEKDSTGFPLRRREDP